jgi:uncharacterized protein
MNFFLRLNPPRPTFPGDITDDERTIMTSHIEYWQPYLENGTLLVFGPVMDPKGVFGMAVISVDSEEHARELAVNDPATRIGTVDVIPMKASVKKKA